jgi:hypothetical protein
MEIPNVISDMFHKYKYYGITGILTIVVGFVYTKYATQDKDIAIQDIATKGNLPAISRASAQPIPVHPSPDILQFMKLFKILTKDLKESITDKKDSNRDKKDNLYNKDIVTKKILVDSHSIAKHIDHNTSSYTVSFGSSDNPNTYKNVIGFRLLKAIITLSPFHIIDGHNTFTVVTTLITIPQGYYAGITLAAAIETAINGTALAGYTVAYTKYTLKYTISHANPFTLDLTGSRRVAKILGFNATSYYTVNTYTSDFAGNFRLTYVDLVIPEIPSIACKDNSKGLAIIDRIPLVPSFETSALSFYQTNSSEYQSQNYFFPMKLSSLTIQMYQDSDQTVLYDSQNGDNTFEFEVTILKNTSIMNM